MAEDKSLVVHKLESRNLEKTRGHGSIDVACGAVGRVEGMDV